ncbi:hypothetical protein GOP47_0017423 [Adiantum capillus-veneris]|uniref:Uncharacterized protein n=1 Tax=Adiantum capillus-veneris TaxID=13818 RepID=A0A9D4ZAR6_ADICA|nr:hypothetical protein GOP47_0017423 [Adiantum capillus-veneris]
MANSVLVHTTNTSPFSPLSHDQAEGVSLSSTVFRQWFFVLWYPLASPNEGQVEGYVGGPYCGGGERLQIH